MALMDTINKIRNTSPVAPKTVSQDELQDIARLSASGKDRSASGSRASSLGQQRAQNVANTQGQQAQLQTNTAASKIGDNAAAVQGQQALQGEQQDQRFGQQKQELATQALLGSENRANQLEQSRAGLDSQSRMKNEQISSQYQQGLDQLASSKGLQTNDIFQAFEQSNLELADRKDAVELEQLAHTMSMKDTEYVNNLEQIGQEQRLNDQNNWEAQINDVLWSNEEAAVRKKNGLDIDLAKDEMELKKRLNDMSASTALEMAQAESKSAAVGSIVTGSTELAGGAYEYSQKKDVPTPTPAPAKVTK